jgi:hypothetical protein
LETRECGQRANGEDYRLFVIANIFGGLGNQMFQYATARAVALRSGARLLLDLGDMEGRRHEIHNGFELDRHFRIKARRATQAEIRDLLGVSYTGFARRVLRRPAFRLLRSRRLVVEPHFHYWHGIRDVRAPCYLHGYWQSHRYFEEIADELRRDFSPAHDIPPRVADLLEQVRSTRSVSLHIRRGDYVKNPRTSKFHGNLGESYYHEAVTLVREKVGNIELFIFSDDLNWVRREMRFDVPAHYVDGNVGDASYLDMLLMSNCSHNIIANSTFSWWAAWLNGNAGKIVICPKRWFADEAVDTRDVCPDWMHRI